MTQSVADRVFTHIKDLGISSHVKADDFTDINAAGLHRRTSVCKALRDLVDLRCLVVDGYTESSTGNKKPTYRIISLNRVKEDTSSAIQDLGLWTDLFMNPVPFPEKVRRVYFD